MKFEVNTTPPTQQEIDQERKGLEGKIKVQTRIFLAHLMLIIVLILVVPLVLGSIGLLSWKAALALAAVLAFAAATLGLAVVLAFVVAPAFVTLFIAGEPGAFTDASVLAFLAALTAMSIAVYVRIAIDRRLDQYRAALAALTVLPDQSEDCIPLVEVCLADQRCDTYRQAVVQQGRALVMGEVNAMIRWAEGAEQREADAKADAEAQHRRQEACAILKSSEKLAC